MNFEGTHHRCICLQLLLVFLQVSTAGYYRVAILTLTVGSKLWILM